MNHHQFPEQMVLDFDGVIVDSTGIKTEAFDLIFSRYPEVHTQALEHHLTQKGVSRFDKFHRLVFDLLGRDDSGMVQALADEFGRIVEERIRDCPFVPGAEHFLESWHPILPLFIASATPQEELLRIVRYRRLSGYFRRVLGGPMRKAELLRGVLNETGSPPHTLMFVGDSGIDLEAAEEVGVPFLGVGPKRCFPPEVRCFADLHALHQHLIRWKEQGLTEEGYIGSGPPLAEA
ncbi:HAD family hydrolase [Gemmatimonadota bacterium]